MLNIFHILAQNINCGYTLGQHRRGHSNEYHSLCLGAKLEKRYAPVNHIFPLKHL